MSLRKPLLGAQYPRTYTFTIVPSIKMLPKLEKWQWTAFILCAFGLFKEFRPSEPFVTEYLIEYKNITQDVIVHDAYPVSTYSYLGTLAVVFLVTDFLRYRSVIIFEGAAYVATWVLLIWGQGFTALMVIEVIYGLASSTEVAYYTYIYAKVERANYKRVTSYTYSAILFGRFFAAVAAQALVSFDLLDYYELNFLSLASLSIAFGFALLLPRVKRSIYFYGGELAAEGAQEPLSFAQRLRKVYRVLWRDFLAAFSNSYVVRWSLWWAVATAGHLQVINFIQAMWETIAAYHQAEIYNGAVEAIQTALSATLALGVGYLQIPWSVYGNWTMSATSIICGAALIIISKTTELYVAYVCYVLFRTIFQVTITVASAEVAQLISEDSCGLIFGVNTFVALVLQTILTLVVTDRRGLALEEADQFMVYGAGFAALGIVYLFLFAFECGKSGCKTTVRIQTEEEEGPGRATDEPVQPIDCHEIIE